MSHFDWTVSQNKNSAVLLNFTKVTLFVKKNKPKNHLIKKNTIFSKIQIMEILNFGRNVLIKKIQKQILFY